MKLNRTCSFVMGGVVALVLGSGTAYAATGGTFVLGHSNQATSTTTLVNSKGTPLSLTAKSGYAPLKVNSGTKVTNLNSDKLDGLSSGSFLRSTGKAADADRLDGKDSQDFATTAGRTDSIGYGGKFTDTDGDGTNDAVFAYADCPAGTLLTGGGFDNQSGGKVVSNLPYAGNEWDVFVSLDGTSDQEGKVGAYALCYNPRGALVFPATQALKRTPSTAALHRSHG